MSLTDQQVDELRKNNVETLYRRIKGESVEFPQQSTYQVKLEDTAKGIRITVHVYATSKDQAVTDAFSMYLMCQTEAENKKILVAPMSVGEKV